jgi:hypothetical protein
MNVKQFLKENISKKLVKSEKRFSSVAVKGRMMAFRNQAT